MVVFDTLKFKLTVDLVAEATGVRNEGEMWFKKLLFTLIPKDTFYQTLPQTGAKEY